MANINTIEQEFFWQAVTGQIDVVSAWDDYVERMMNAGLDRLLIRWPRSASRSAALPRPAWRLMVSGSVDGLSTVAEQTLLSGEKRRTLSIGRRRVAPWQMSRKVT